MQKAMNLMALASVVSLTTQLAVLLYYSHEDYVDYSDRSLFHTTFIYTFSLGIFFMLISEYYDGDNFLFSKQDALFYFKQSSKVWEVGLSDNIMRIMREFESEDWGALFYDTIALYLVPNKLFVNFINTFLGATGAVYLYRIGKCFMPYSYAFLASLAYSTSSYIVFFNCSFLKESIFVFFVISVLYYHYQYVLNNSRLSLFGMILCVGILFFFRPAVAAFIVLSLFVYYAIKQKGNALSLFLYGAAIIGILLSMKLMMDTIESNTAGGNMDAVLEDTNNSSYSAGFNLFMSFFGAFFGPFPALIQRFEEPSYVEFLGAGLTYKLFLVGPFWYGIYAIIKNREIELYPLAIFISVEMLATGAVMASLELRKVILHVPFMYIIAYYGIYKGFLPIRMSHLSALPTYLFVVAVVLLWNVIKVKT